MYKSVLILLGAAGLLATADQSAQNVVDRAIQRMGGDSLLSAVQRVRYEYTTEWSRITFDERPFTDSPSIESNVEMRDYSIGGWRNNRRSGQFEYLDIVRDSAGIRFIRNAWSALNIAYIDERNELFTYTPDRLLLHARASKDLKVGPDTLIGGVPHTRVSGTINGYPGTIFFRKSDDLPAMFRFHASAENDFGLTPWGPMDVEVWYSRWATLQNRMSVPLQWDIKRVGKLYKRLIIGNQVINPMFAADSFAIPDSLRHVFNTTQRKPMHDVPFDSVGINNGSFFSVVAFGAPVGAVKVGDSWLMLEAGQAPLSAERFAQVLQQKTGGSLKGAILTSVAQGNGGVAWLVQQKQSVWTAPGARPFVDVMLRNRGIASTTVATPATSRWLRVAGDSVYIEPFDFPNARGSALVWVPAHKYLYAAPMTGWLEINMALDRARERGWTVERLGSSRGVLASPPSR